MKQISPDVLESIQRLGESTSVHSHFDAFVNWLRESLEEQHDLNDELDGSELNRGQGRALALKEILRTVDTAKDVLAAYAGRVRTSEARRTSTM